MVDSAKLMRALEALLLCEQSPRSIQSIAKQLQCQPEAVAQSIQGLAEQYRQHGHGIEITVSEQGAFLLPTPEAWAVISAHYRTHEHHRLPPAAVETLAIIAYSQPITVPEIEQLRGVGVSHSIRLLLAERLIAVSGVKKAPGSPKLYGTTAQFLRIYNLESIRDLPELEQSERLRFLTAAR